MNDRRYLEALNAEDAVVDAVVVLVNSTQVC